MGTKQIKILLSFIGSNDAGQLLDQPDGAILTALTNEKFDQAYLIWNKGVTKKISYKTIANYLMKEIVERKLAKKVESNELQIKDVTDHNNIYHVLKEYSDKLDKTEKYSYTAAISSGTPAMQVCWILMAESGDFSESSPLRLIKVKDPKFGESENIPVKIDTNLPKIVRLKEEVETLKKDLIPKAIINVEKAELKIGKELISLTPIELCYFKYFAERLLEEKGSEKFPIYNTTNAFLDKIISIHKEFFPDSESGRQNLIRIRKREIGLDITTFRGNISKLNKKIKQSIRNESIIEAFQIKSGGIMGAKHYGINAPKEKIQIIKR